jgi:hypothetical protein
MCRDQEEDSNHRFLKNVVRENRKRTRDDIHSCIVLQKLINKSHFMKSHHYKSFNLNFEKSRLFYLMLIKSFFRINDLMILEFSRKFDEVLRSLQSIFLT